MIDVILIDDESKSLIALEWELTHFCENIMVVGKFTKPEEALDFLKNNAIDAIFLDIEMPQMDGFQFLERINSHDFAIIFTTAYDQYAIQAIKERALDYILKPVDSDDLKVTIDKIMDFKKAHQLKKSLEERILSVSNFAASTPKKVPISMDGKLIFVQPNTIIYCQSDGNYCHIYLEKNEKLFVTKKLKEIEELLPDYLFFRIHNSYLINLEKVNEYFKTDGFVVMSNRKKIPVSRNRKNSFLDKI